MIEISYAMQTNYNCGYLLQWTNNDVLAR